MLCSIVFEVFLTGNTLNSVDLGNKGRMIHLRVETSKWSHQKKEAAISSLAVDGYPAHQNLRATVPVANIF